MDQDAIGAGSNQEVAGYYMPCLLYTSDAADERSSVDLGGRRIIKKKKRVSIDGGPEINIYNTVRYYKHINISKLMKKKNSQ